MTGSEIQIQIQIQEEARYVGAEELQPRWHVI